MDDVSKWLMCSFDPTWGSGLLSENSTSSFIPKSSATPLLSTVANLVVKLWLSFNLWDRNKLPDVSEWVIFYPPVKVAFRSRGSLTSAHLSNFQAARSRSEYLAGCSMSTLWANIHQYLGFRPSQNQSLFISSTCSCWIFPGYSNWSMWTCCDNCTPNLATFFLILVWGGITPCSRHQMSLPCHNAHPKSGGCQVG